MLTLALTDEGYDVRAGPDGRQALDLLDPMMADVDAPAVILSAARDVPAETLRPAAVAPEPLDSALPPATVADPAR